MTNFLSAALMCYLKMSDSYFFSSVDFLMKPKDANMVFTVKALLEKILISEVYITFGVLVLFIAEKLP